LGGQKKLPLAFKIKEHSNLQFSFVVAMRNEEHNIAKLLASLSAQNFQHEQFEIILVDDFSTDQTLEVAQQTIVDLAIEHLVKVVSLQKEGLSHNAAFKKTAIQIGVSKAKFEWIVTTDADCFHSPNYLQTLAGFIEQYLPKFVSGPVSLSPAKNMFQKMQALEFKGLVGLGAAYIQRNRPFLCNGANLAFTKEVFSNLNGYKGIDHFERGDDIWFLHKVQERYPFEIFFAMHPNLLVKTEPCPNVNAFLEQRKRWTAKNSGYKKLSQLFTLGFDYLFYCSILINFLLSFFSDLAFDVLLLSLLSKMLVEINFYAALQKHLKNRFWLATYFYTFPVQIFYVVAIYPLSQLTKFTWKNRFFNA